MRGLVLSALALPLLLAALARAAGGKSWSLEPSYRGTLGSDGYAAGDASLYAGLPGGFSLDLGHGFFRSDSSSMSHTYTAGAGWSGEQVSVSGSHSVTPLVNDYRSRSWEAGISLNTASEDFRTTVGARTTVSYQTFFARAPAFTQRIDFTQRSPALRLSQRLRGTTAEVEAVEHSYNKDLAAVVNRISQVDPKGNRTAGLKGLVKGFPEYSVRAGLTQRLEAPALTLWATYQNTKLVEAGRVLPGGRADSYKGGAELELFELLACGFEYERVRQTEQPAANYYGLSLSARF